MNGNNKTETLKILEIYSYEEESSKITNIPITIVIVYLRRKGHNSSKIHVLSKVWWQKIMKKYKQEHRKRMGYWFWILVDISSVLYLGRRQRTAGQALSRIDYHVGEKTIIINSWRQEHHIGMEYKL